MTTTKKNLKLYRGIREDESVVFAEFEKDFDVINQIKKFGNFRWCPINFRWYIRDKDFVLSNFFQFMLPHVYINYSNLTSRASKDFVNTNNKRPLNFPSNGKSLEAEGFGALSAEMLNEINAFRDWLKQRRYSSSTVKTYTGALSIFFQYFSYRNIDSINNDDLIKFNNRYILKNSYSSSYQNQVINAIKLYYQTRFKSVMDISEIRRPRRSRVLPKVIPKDDIRRMLLCIPNLKHKTALTLIYALGLRRSELLNLKLLDVLLTRRMVIIRNAKGRKDRSLPLSGKLIVLIEKYLAAVGPETYLIEGQYRGHSYSAASLEKIFHKYLGEVLPGNNFTLHCLRHSYATHLLESGVDLRYIQELLGHKSSRTTEIYTYVSMQSLVNIKNPTDDFEL